MYKKVFLKGPSEARFRPGHPWIYRSQIQSADGGPKPGEWVEVLARNKKPIGVGYYNPQSEITVRLLSREPIDSIEAFLKAKIEAAIGFRKRFVRETNAFRVISSEADGLPGLIVDLYGEVLVVQFLTAGMEALKNPILQVLSFMLQPKGIFERSDSHSRESEGLDKRVGWIEQNCGAETVIFERDVRYTVRFGEGHKTGLYLDQRENRFMIRDLGIRGRVLDAFCYVGGFGLHLAKAGCEVLGIDSQEDAIRLAEQNRDLNGIDPKKLQFETGNCFDELRNLEKKKEKFDLVILDPPSFVKRKKELAGAVAGQKEIVLRSMKLLNPGGFLAVFSCSFHMDEGLLMQICMSAAVDTRRDLRVIKFFKQSLDHPINPFIPETYYLKGFLFST